MDMRTNVFLWIWTGALTENIFYSTSYRNPSRQQETGCKSSHTGRDCVTEGN